MPVPSTQEIRKPLLEAFRDEAPHSFVINEFLAIIAADFEENLDDMSSTEKTALKNNINEAKSYLRKHKLLSHPSKNTYMITRAGSKVLEDNPEIIDDNYFNPKPKEEETSAQEPLIEEQEQQSEIPVDFSEQEFINAPEEEIAPEISEEAEEIEIKNENEFETASKEEQQQEPELEEEAETQEDFFNETEKEIENEDDDPIDTEEELEMQEIPDFKENKNIDIEDVLANYNSKLSEEVLERAANLSPDMFCMLVMDLLSKMGYRAFQTARYTNDAEGSDLIHGVILENKAGMIPIYVHARKLSPSRTVGKADMIDFINALADKGGKGIFATTGTFSEQAEISANDEKIMLLDGKKLASLMIANNFCVKVEKIFELKAIDSESFSEYEG